MSVVSELREMADDRAAKFSIGHYWNICDQAADELERLERKADDAVMLIHKLQAENERLLIDNRVLADSAADVINEKQSLRVKVINLGGTP